MYSYSVWINNFLCSFLLRKRDSIRVFVFCMDQITFFVLSFAQKGLIRVDQIILRSFLWRTFRDICFFLSCYRSLQRYYFLDFACANLFIQDDDATVTMD